MVLFPTALLHRQPAFPTLPCPQPYLPHHAPCCTHCPTAPLPLHSSTLYKTFLLAPIICFLASCLDRTTTPHQPTILIIYLVVVMLCWYLDIGSLWTSDLSRVVMPRRWVYWDIDGLHMHTTHHRTLLRAHAHTAHALHHYTRRTHTTPLHTTPPAYAGHFPRCSRRDAYPQWFCAAGKQQQRFSIK